MATEASLETILKDYVAEEGRKEVKIPRLVRCLKKTTSTELTTMLLSVSDMCKTTVIHFAARRGHVNLLSCIIDKIDSTKEFCKLVKRKTLVGLNAIHHAAEKGCLLTLEFLLNKIPTSERVVVLMERSNYGNTPLHYAAENGRWSTLEFILSQIPEHKRLSTLKIQDKSGSTAMHQAALNGHVEIIALLAKNVTADECVEILKIRTTDHNTALHYAANVACAEEFNNILAMIPEEQRLELLKMQDDDGDTALHISVENNHTDSVKSILECLPPGQRLDLLGVSNETEQTPSEVAMENSDRKTILLLKQFAEVAETLSRRPEEPIDENPAVTSNYDAIALLRKEGEEIAREFLESKTLRHQCSMRIETLESKSEDVRRRLEECENERDEWKRRYSSVENTLGEIALQLRRNSAQLDQLVTANQELADANRTLASIVVDRQTSCPATKIEELQKEKQQLEVEHQNTSEELSRCQAELEKCEKRIRSLRQDQEAASHELAKYNRKLQEYLKVIEILQERRNSISAKIFDHEVKIHHLQNQLFSPSTPQLTLATTLVAQPEEETPQLDFLKQNEWGDDSSAAEHYQSMEFSSLVNGECSTALVADSIRPNHTEMHETPQQEATPDEEKKNTKSVTRNLQKANK